VAGKIADNQIKKSNVMKFIPLFFLFVGVSIGLKAQDSAKLISAHQQKLKEAMLYTLEVAEKMPEAQYGYRPTPEEMSFGEQLLHLGDNLVWLSSSFLAEMPLPHRSKVEGQAMNKAEVMRLLAESYGFVLRELEVLDAKSLTKEFPWKGGVMNKIQFLNLIQDHQTHHRAQAIVYLRLNQVVPPPYRGW
jgi:uncharacterized damage-inducible protein DinB